MTLREKFKDVLINPIYQMTMIDKQIEIADEFAIEFGEYLDSLTAEDMGTTPIKEFLEFFKKEKGL